jgi:polyisoprenoid-binding protein YceI
MNKKRLLIGGLSAVMVVVLAAWFFLFRGDSPDAVDVAAANAQLDEDLASSAATEDDVDDEALTATDGEVDEGLVSTDDNSAAGFDGELDGVWIIDDEIGDFDFETASGSFAGFRVDEELTVGAVVAVGRSGGVTGSLTIEAGRLVATEVVVDMNAIVSNDSRREGAIRRAVGASTNPTATFVLGDPVDLPAGLANGEIIRIEATGSLTVNGVTNPVTFMIGALVRNDGFGIITGSTEIVFEDFGVTPPTAPIVVSVDDTGIVEFQLVVAKG